MVVLSGMSTLAQVEENTAALRAPRPLTEEEIALLGAIKAAYRQEWKYNCEDFSLLDDNPYGVPVSGILRTYDSLLLQPNPLFGAELNYYKSFRSAYGPAFESGGLRGADRTDRQRLRRDRRAAGSRGVSDHKQLPDLHGVRRPPPPFLLPGSGIFPRRPAFCSTKTTR